MQLRGHEYGGLFCAPGARGFFGEGYPFHRYWRLFGMTWSGTSFVAKTTTLHARLGNMPLREDGITPREPRPKCIAVKPLSGHVVNAVGLSGPGARVLFETGRWQRLAAPFMLSFMAVSQTKDERMEELQEYVRLAKRHLPNFRAPVAQQLNFACPNAGLYPDELGEEIGEALEIAAEMGVPLVPNFNPVVPLKVMLEAASHPHCDALWVGNTIPWGDPRINWPKLFGEETSPLTKRGLSSAGGLSGPACLPLVVDRVVQAKEAGIKRPMVAGNGIQSVADARYVLKAGAAAIAVGVVGIVRPWQLRNICNYFDDNGAYSF